MISTTEQLRPHMPRVSRLFSLFRKDDDVIDQGQIYNRATLRAIRALPPHILRDIGAEHL